MLDVARNVLAGLGWVRAVYSGWQKKSLASHAETLPGSLTCPGSSRVMVVSAQSFLPDRGRRVSVKLGKSVYVV